MNAGDIARALGDARREGRGWRCRCPLHGGRSLTLRDGGAGVARLDASVGCDRTDVLAELRRRGLLDRRATDYRRPLLESQAGRRSADRASTRHLARGAASSRKHRREIFGDSRHLAGRMAGGVALSPSVSTTEGRGRQPSSAATGHGGDGRARSARAGCRSCDLPAAEQDDGKADIPKEQQKASFGPIKGGAVRLGIPRAGEWLAIGEGLETTLSVAAACAMPAWAALSAGGIRSLVLPREAADVIISADHDANGVGERAARDVAARWLGEGRRVKLALPPIAGVDFNDILRGVASVPTEEARRVAD